MLCAATGLLEDTVQVRLRTNAVAISCLHRGHGVLGGVTWKGHGRCLSHGRVRVLCSRRLYRLVLAHILQHKKLLGLLLGGLAERYSSQVLVLNRLLRFRNSGRALRLREYLHVLLMLGQLLHFVRFLAGLPE